MINEELIDKLCEGSDRQLDDAVKHRLRRLLDLDKVDRPGYIKHILDDSVRYSLTSDFVVRVLEMMYVDAREKARSSAG